MTPKRILPILFAGTAAALPLQAATIVYSFDSQSAAVTSNDLSGDGVTAGNIDIINGGSGGWEIGSNQINELDAISMKFGGTANAKFSFTITIPSSVTISLTGLDFAFDYESNNASGSDYYAKWDLALSQGSASASTGSVGPYTPGVKEIATAESLALSGLTDLSDTTVTFTFSADNGTSTSYTNGNANDRRTIFDDITLTAIVIPEPSTTALMGLAAMGLCLHRRRK